MRRFIDPQEVIKNILIYPCCWFSRDLTLHGQRLNVVKEEAELPPWFNMSDSYFLLQILQSLTNLTSFKNLICVTPQSVYKNCPPAISLYIRFGRKNISL
ncbi:hypothetical protein CHS0354_025346 [Potamilus streckersoni]|uniref:Uncharacterized protein n=1 Tax=Potamilus streckersoni TaxID=2493646 RepID=A0AAE0VYU9_9BIVA|nr:hypothetical protein CHS0354_025346 [Potamilus streckersoni]